MRSPVEGVLLVPRYTEQHKAVCTGTNLEGSAAWYSYSCGTHSDGCVQQVGQAVVVCKRVSGFRMCKGLDQKELARR
eukprot:scaffold272776_cov24-Prasinocladus_malaysianus.AAC.1